MKTIGKTGNSSLPKKKTQTKIVEWLVNLKVTKGINNVHFLIMSLMVTLFICLTYLVFHNYYDVYVIFLFAPLIYCAIVYRGKGAIIGSFIFIGILLPSRLAVLSCPLCVSQVFCVLVLSFFSQHFSRFIVKLF